MKFLIFNLSVVTALAYLILGQDQLSDIGRTISERGTVSLEKAITFLNTPHTKEIIEQTIGIKTETAPEKKRKEQPTKKQPNDFTIDPSHRPFVDPLTEWLGLKTGEASGPCKNSCPNDCKEHAENATVVRHE